tara:strand:- start:944 stop:1270 length:327 start_codon:yes stop_codon:yes gene_type:complete
MMPRRVHDAMRASISRTETQRSKKARTEATLEGERECITRARETVAEIKAHALSQEHKLGRKTLAILEAAAATLQSQIEMNARREEEHLALMGELLKQSAVLACYHPQ